MKYRILAILIVVLASAPFCPAVEYQVIDLGELSTLYGELWCPLSMNDPGQVAGCSPFIPGGFSAFVWEDSKKNYISNGLDIDWANNINNNAVVVGAEFDGVINVTPFYWRNGMKTVLETLSYESNGEALAVNDSGKIVGNIFKWDKPNLSKASLWKDGAAGKEIVIIERLYVDDEYNYAADINNNDKVVGYSGKSSSRQRAFIWQEGRLPRELVMFPGDLRAVANAINNLDQVVGYTTGIEGEDHAVLWQNDAIIPLGSLDSESWAFGINDNEQVVGVYATAEGISAFLWENGKIIDLNDQLVENSGWILYEAHDINNDGWIVGVGLLNQSSKKRGFLLVPLPDETVTAQVRITPQVLNLKRKSEWITCHLQLPAEYDVFDIDPASLRLWGEFAPDLDKVRIDPDAQMLTARFARADIERLLWPGMVEFVVSGELLDGTKFAGADEIRVLGK